MKRTQIPHHDAGGLVKKRSLARAMVSIFGLVVSSSWVIASGSQTPGWKDLKVPLELPSLSTLGSYGGDLRVALSGVSDACFCEMPYFIGTAEAGGRVVLTIPREEALSTTMTRFLKETGLEAQSAAAADYLADVTIRRARLLFPGALIRAEVFLELSFKRGNELVGRVLACGNAQAQRRSANYISNDKIRATFHAALGDALHKLAESQTLGRLLGEKWAPGSPLATPEKYSITRIPRDDDYGPGPYTRNEILPAVKEAIQRVEHRSLTLLDLELKDEKYLEKKKADPMLPRQLLPELVREHLVAFYPGAFSQIGRRSQWKSTDGLVLGGEVLQFKAGGTELSKSSHEMSLYFRDGITGDVLYTLQLKGGGGGVARNILSAAVSIGVAGAVGSPMAIVELFIASDIRDMEDDVARNLAHVLANAFPRGYSPPSDLEICFDDLPYPAK